jgi:lysophospholipase L1-like esterase
MEKKENEQISRVLLIGDSIRMHYAPLVKNKLKGKAIVVEIPKNGGDSKNVKKHLKKWLKKAHSNSLDIIHLNCGLHDIKRQFNATKNQQPLENYKENLKGIVSCLKDITRAKLVWATTTPVIYERHHAVKGFDRFEEDVKEYKAAATAIMKKCNIPINDLNKVITGNSVAECLLPDGVHMTEKGNGLLADAVSGCITRLLESH